jgi:hypothetical protein
MVETFGILVKGVSSSCHATCFTNRDFWMLDNILAILNWLGGVIRDLRLCADHFKPQRMKLTLRNRRSITLSP